MIRDFIVEFAPFLIGVLIVSILAFMLGLLIGRSARSAHSTAEHHGLTENK